MYFHWVSSQTYMYGTIPLKDWQAFPYLKNNNQLFSPNKTLYVCQRETSACLEHMLSLSLFTNFHVWKYSLQNPDNSFTESKFRQSNHRPIALDVKTSRSRPVQWQVSWQGLLYVLKTSPQHSQKKNLSCVSKMTHPHFMACTCLGISCQGLPYSLQTQTNHFQKKST